jgi:pullulanase
VNFSRFDEPDRRDVFEYVRRLVQLRTSHPALSVNDTDFIHVDFNDGKRVLVLKRGTDNDPVVVVANFSDFTTANALSPGAEYFTPNWPKTPAGRHWFEVTQGRHDRESIFAWEGKVYRLDRARRQLLNVSNNLRTTLRYCLFGDSSEGSSCISGQHEYVI